MRSGLLADRGPRWNASDAKADEMQILTVGHLGLTLRPCPRHGTPTIWVLSWHRLVESFENQELPLLFVPCPTAAICILYMQQGLLVPSGSQCFMRRHVSIC